MHRWRSEFPKRTVTVLSRVELHETYTRLARNTSSLLVADVVGKLIGLAFTTRVAVYLGAEGFGQIAAAGAFAAIAVGVTDLGLASLSVRDVAKDPTASKQYLSNVLTFQALALVVLLSVAAGVSVLLYSNWEQSLIAFLMSVSVGLSAVANLFVSFLRAHQLMSRVAVIRVSTAAVQLGAALLAIAISLPVLPFVSVYLVTSVFALAVAAVSYRRLVGPVDLKLDWKWMRSALHLAVPFAAYGWAQNSYGRLDILFLERLSGRQDAGLYSAAALVSSLISFPFVSFDAAFLPALAQRVAVSPDSAKLVFQRILPYLWAAAVGLGLVVTLHADTILGSLFDYHYAGAASFLRLFAWATIVINMNGFSNVLVSFGYQRVVAAQVVACAALHIPLSYFLIVNTGLTGLAISSIVTETAGLLLLGAAVWRIGLGLQFMNMMRTLFGLAVGIALVRALNLVFETSGPLVLFPVEAGVFVVVVFLTVLWGPRAALRELQRFSGRRT